MYCNALFSLVTFGVYAVTGWEPLLLVVLMQQVEMLHQLLPVLRLDGYYILADLTGVPDLFRRVGPILRSLRPGHDREPLVDALKPRVRLAVTAWVLIVVPLLLFQLVLLVAHLPRIFATSWDSMRLQFEAIDAGFSDGDPLTGLAGTAQVLALAIPLIGISLTLYRVAKRVGAAVVRRPVLRVVAAVMTAGAVAFWLWPDGDYEPIRPDERWRVQDMVAATFTGVAAPAPTSPAAAPAPAPSPPASDGSAPTSRPEGPAAQPAPEPTGRLPLPTVTLPPVTIPTVTVPPVTTPSVSTPVATVPPETLPPETVPSTTVPTTLPSETVPPP